jgi:serine/threonine-protein kinase
VILYELLCGKMPVDFTDLNLTQAAVKLQHSEPALLGNLDRTLRGDLEAIAAKALEKDPARRYQAVSELSADIRRHLCGETVLARPQTAWYQGMKYARRHKALVVAGGLLVLSLIAGIVGTSWQAMRASAQGEQARVQASLAEQTSGFLSRILKSPRPEVSRGKDVTVREILDAASKELADDKDLDPRVAAGIWRTLGESYWALSHYPAALASAQRLRDLRLRFAGPDDRDTIWAEGFYGFQLVKTEQREQAIAVLEELLPRARRVLGEADLITIDIRASLARAYLIYTVDPQAVEKALALATENIDITRATFGPDHQRSIQAVSEKWSIHRTFRRKFTPEEIGQITDHWRRAQQLFGHESPPAINALSVCVEALSYNQSISELKAVVTEALPQLRARFGDEHLLIAGLEQQLADVCRREGNLAESARLYDRVYSARRKLEGPDAVRTRVCGFHAVEAHSAARQCARAREILDQRLADARQREASFTPATADHWLEFNIAWCERDLPAMRRLDELLKGSVYEAQTSKHIAILEKELAELAPQPPKD